MRQAESQIEGKRINRQINQSMCEKSFCLSQEHTRTAHPSENKRKINEMIQTCITINNRLTSEEMHFKTKQSLDSKNNKILRI